MIVLNLSGRDDKLEHKIQIVLDINQSSFIIDSRPFNYNSPQLFNDLNDYNRNQSADVPFISRKFFQHFKVINNDCIINMLRAFACSNGYLNFHVTDFNSSQALKHKIKIARENFYNRLLIDWSGKQEEQPQMYFIENELIEKKFSDLQKLYDKQLLQKYSILFCNEKVETMYVPFVYPEIKNYNIINTYLTWKKIVGGINSEIRRLTNNNRKY